jgi:hypothetical protein
MLTKKYKMRCRSDLAANRDYKVDFNNCWLYGATGGTDIDLLIETQEPCKSFIFGEIKQNRGPLEKNTRQFQALTDIVKNLGIPAIVVAIYGVPETDGRLLLDHCEVQRIVATNRADEFYFSDCCGNSLTELTRVWAEFLEEEMHE